MKRSILLFLLLLVLAILAGVLLSNASWIGKIGVSLFYKDYTFLKIWYKSAALYYACWLLLYTIQYFIQKYGRRTTSILTHVSAIALAIAGLFFSYSSFRQNLSHSMMGERFQFGVYLFWVGWMLISVFFLFQKKNKKTPSHHSIVTKA